MRQEQLQTRKSGDKSADNCGRSTMTRCLITLGLILATAPTFGAGVGKPQGDAPLVVLLHGLARSVSSMSPMASSLESQGFRVCNIAYPSREHSITVLAADYVAPGIARCAPNPDEPLDFVTHSLGGIIVRQLAASGSVKSFGRVVMLGPPNHGSEVVDVLGGWRLFQAINGPAGGELGTSMDSLPNRLGAAPFEVGIISGSRSINWLLSTFIPGVDDGKVSVSSAKLDGMKDFLMLPSSHPFIMKDPEAIQQTIYFLKYGSFVHSAKQKESVTQRASSDLRAEFPPSHLPPLRFACPPFAKSAAAVVDFETDISDGGVEMDQKSRLAGPIS